MMIDANGIGIEADIFDDADGPWVMLSHSVSCTRGIWAGQIPALAERYKVLAYDTRGHGGTGSTTPPYDFELLAADAVGLMDAVEIDSAHFAGLSLGGMTALALALGHPDRLKSISVMDSRADFPAEHVHHWRDRLNAVKEGGMETVVEMSVERWFTAPFREANPDLMETVRGMVRATSVDGFLGCGGAIMGLDFEPRLGEIKLPALFLVGSEDQGTPPDVAQRMHRAVKGSGYVEIDPASHLSSMEQPERVTRALLDFLVGI